MAKQIRMTAEEIDAAMAKAREQLTAQKSSDGKIKVEVTLPVVKKRVRIQFSTIAYVKMLSLIQEFATEVAWHGIVTKEGDGLFRISDILVYPQEVTGATVRTGEEYRNWLFNLDDKTFGSLRMQGHSHVSMSASPSSQDLSDQSITLDQMGSRCKFYIFMVWNKSLKHDVRVYDLEANLLYEDGDVDISIGESGVDLASFIAGAKEMVRTPAKIIPARQESYFHQGYSDYPDDDPWPLGKGPVARTVKARKKP